VVLNQTLKKRSRPDLWRGGELHGNHQGSVKCKTTQREKKEGKHHEKFPTIAKNLRDESSEILSNSF